MPEFKYVNYIRTSEQHAFKYICDFVFIILETKEKPINICESKSGGNQSHTNIT